MAVALPVEVRDGRGFTLQSTRDISTGGVFFDRAIPYGVGVEVELSFTLPGESRAIRCRGEVVNVPDAKSFGMGVRFLDLAPIDRAALAKFVGDSA
ncbi:MAG: PilZ domain-containing protein [Myxococcaceae bacterium]|nr:PilZ domain-containing protein [Myxococcaceae bacterium]